MQAVSTLVRLLSDFVLIDSYEKTGSLEALLKQKCRLPPENFAKSHPDEYRRDIVRLTLHVENSSFLCGMQDENERLALNEIDQALLDLISRLPNCPLAESTEGVHLIRYLIQELLSANLFVLDKEFQAMYTQDAYVPKNELLFPLEKGSRESSISVLRTGSVFTIRAVQYWKVANAGDPSKIKGYDALQVVVTIDLNGAARDSVLSCFDTASCHLRFHGFCPNLEAITY